jgi:amidase
MRRKIEPPAWQHVAATRRSLIESKIPPEWRVPGELLKSKNFVDLPRRCGIMTEQELSITELSAVEIVSLIQAGKISAVATTKAFCKRAAIAHQAVRNTNPSYERHTSRGLHC